ncbi:Forkhead associated (FHA) domain, binds pSer, pThr, pTyr [Enhydrobacter aerosaccus]|uniref:Forkhead associated (FHA) domain, binds pSer, pThr, pTyr n=1 Tax=Enhydrobacter aerosaccus TaxID=225324 RepID=A0A1T4QCP5_9HYPH|nr:FHA domain-containing protein [Enhydrobacter aerosaccus]SKA00998.1 Forkhead associated (FHA) domain, binds pSer, pThr, pTyr [Enhydrobacter aerosaccus]
MGTEVVALMGLAGLSSAFALVSLVLAAWMAWRIVEKAGLPGWTGMGAILLTLTAVGTIVPLVLLWVFAFMRWPRDTAVPFAASAGPVPTGSPPPPPGNTATARPTALPPPPKAIPDARRWLLTGKLPDGQAVALSVDASAPAWILTGAPAGQPTELSVPDPSVGQPHARLMVAGARLGLADLGSPGGTYIDGARLLPEHGPRDITSVRTLRVGTVELTLSRP